MNDRCYRRNADYLDPFDGYLKRGYVVTYKVDKNNEGFVFGVSKDHKHTSDIISYNTMKTLGPLLGLTVHQMIERLISEIERMG